ncbi:MAG: hypothetical protein WDO68_17535 [Gammaproteobacteria bacterium]
MNASFGALPRNTPTAAPTNNARRSERRFFSGMAIALLLTVFAGFAPTYYLRGTFGSPPLTPSLWVHGFAFSAWMVLLVIQTSLIAANRIDIHRRLGVGGGALAVLMMVLGAYVAISRTASGEVLSPPGVSPLAFLTVSLAAIIVFPVLLGSAMGFRKRPDIHKRLVLIATLELVMAAVGRLPGIFNPLGPIALGVAGLFVVTDLFLVPIAVYDWRSRGRLHPATLWGGAFFIISQPLRGMLGTTAAWTSFAAWLTS